MNAAASQAASLAGLHPASEYFHKIQFIFFFFRYRILSAVYFGDLIQNVFKKNVHVFHSLHLLMCV